MNRGSFMQPETQTRWEEGEEEREKEGRRKMDGVRACVRAREKKEGVVVVDAQAHWFENDNVKACP